ncbi:MAG: MFS transporter, partial [Roseibium sp.]
LDLLPHFAGWSLFMAIPLVFALRTPWASEKTGPGGKRPPFVAIPKGGLFFVGIMALIAALGEGAITDWAALYQIQELGFESSEAAVGFAAFSVAMVVMRFCGDQVIARFGAVPVARASGIAAAFGCVLLVWGQSIWMIWAGCVVMGLGNAVIFPLAMSRAAADPTMSKGAALASVATLGYGAFLFGPPILGFIGDAFSLRASFALVAMLALLIAGLAGALKVRP